MAKYISHFKRQKNSAFLLFYQKYFKKFIKKTIDTVPVLCYNYIKKKRIPFLRIKKE